jgi:hypothetical protein
MGFIAPVYRTSAEAKPADRDCVAFQRQGLRWGPNMAPFALEFGTLSSMTRFRGTLQLDGKTATGITVPDEVIAELGGGNRPRVRVTLGAGAYSWPVTIGRMGGAFKIPVSAAVRQAAGVNAGDELDVDLVLDQTPAELVIPGALADALAEDATALAAFDKLAPSRKKAHVVAIEGAKTDETRQRRLDKILAELRG